MSEITKAIEDRQGQIVRLQSDIEALQRAASVLGGKATVKRQSTTTSKSKRKWHKKDVAAKATVQTKTTQKRKRSTWSAADREAISRRMKAYWAKRRKAKG